LKKLKSIFVLVLALVLVAGMLSGCAAKPATPSPSASASTSASASASAPASSSPSASASVSASAPAAAGDTIKIGVLTYLSSARSATLGFFQIGWEVAGAQINKAGGIGGKQVEFILFDPANDAAQVPQRLTDAKSQGCVAAIFACGDDLAPAAATWADQNKFPVAIMSNTSTEITIKHFSKYAFNCGLNAWSFAKVLALAAVKDDGKKNFIFCGTDGAATIDAENLLLLEGQKINPDFKDLNSYRVNADDSQFSTIISSIAAAKPDMVLQQGGGPTFVAFAQQGNMFGLFKVTDVYNDFVVDTSTNSSLAASGAYPYGKTHGIFLVPFWDNSMMDSQMQAFCKDYMANQIAVDSKYVAPADAGLSCYRCAMAIFTGLQDCVKNGKDYTNSDVLADAIKNMSWSDSTGTHKFRDLDNQLTFDIYYGTSTKDGSEAYQGNPVATDIKTYSVDQVLPTEQEMKDYAAKLGVTNRF
jgi:ABC-type branched-subunit amino acid transport system substrate-binding protein